MGEIYCLYSSKDGIPRYVGQTESFARKRYARHVTCAIDMDQGDLYSWIRTEWENEYEVKHYVLQTDIIPAELDFYEEYWINQFPNLLNKKKNSGKKKPTEIGLKVIEAIKTSIEV